MGWLSDFMGLFKPSIVKALPVIVKDIPQNLSDLNDLEVVARTIWGEKKC